ncbi:hypothetical protein J4217_03635 [Candidatus Pacearchaeota archaeon]|nr:hypothetical protein [uncultured archaeon]MBS3091510.1 hypothetical protein [Candidatus Pacearchaeota archaeon]
MKKSVISKEQKVVLSKTYGWIILIGLVILDASLDIIFAEGKGLESPVWKPIANFLGVNNPLFLTPLIMIIFYFGVKGGAWLSKKVDKIPTQAEELVLTTLVIVYGVFVLWLISVYLFNFTLIKNHLYLIPILIIIGIAYSWWAEKKLKK